jgi:hypothetical protein
MKLSNRTLTCYGIAVVIVLANRNVIFWLVGNPQLHELNVFSVGFVLGMLGIYCGLALWISPLTVGGAEGVLAVPPRIFVTFLKG